MRQVNRYLPPESLMQNKECQNSSGEFIALGNAKLVYCSRQMPRGCTAADICHVGVLQQIYATWVYCSRYMPRGCTAVQICHYCTWVCRSADMSRGCTAAQICHLGVEYGSIVMRWGSSGVSISQLDGWVYYSTYSTRICRVGVLQYILGYATWVYYSTYSDMPCGCTSVQICHVRVLYCCKPISILQYS